MTGASDGSARAEVAPRCPPVTTSSRRRRRGGRAGGRQGRWRVGRAVDGLLVGAGRCIEFDGGHVDVERRPGRDDDDLARCRRPVVRVAGSRPGILVFAGARGCRACVAAVRTAAGALRRARISAQLIVVMADAATARAERRDIRASCGSIPCPLRGRRPHRQPRHDARRVDARRVDRLRRARPVGARFGSGVRNLAAALRRARA